MKIAFAEQDGISIRFDQDRIAIVLRVAMLRQGPVTWKDLTVSVFYRLEGDGLEARLVRDGVVQMASPRRLGLHSQVVLRGLFSRIFPADRAVDMIPPAVALNPRMSGLQVTQLEVVEGWVGVAIGPARAEGTPLVARRR